MASKAKATGSRPGYSGNRKLSAVVMPGYHRDRAPGNAGRKWPAEVLTPAQVRALIDEFAHAAAGTRDRAIVLLMYRAGIKIGEVLSMERRHFEPGEHEVVVPAGGNRAERTVPIDLETRQALEEWMQVRLRLKIRPTAPLFCVISEPTKGTALYASCVRESIRDRALSAGIDRRCNPQSLVKSGREHRSASRGRVQLALGDYLQTEQFQTQYPDAYEKWESAVDFFEAHPERNGKQIGLACRDAMLLMVDTAMARYQVSEPRDPTPRRKLHALLQATGGGSPTVAKHADALIEYWWSIYNLAHRQVHDADREEERTTPLDAQRAIFQTIVVMLEISRPMRALPVPTGRPASVKRAAAKRAA